ncbi:MAG: hypothetical protein IJ977_10760 [Fibrobacter sp.]|nr:hypothetical protein [Fibrobacter sp.]
MQRNKKLIVACALVAVTAFGMGASLQSAPVVTAETNTDAILYYDFSAETIGENVEGYSSVTNLGTKANANATIYNGTGLSLNEQLVFDQPNHGTDMTAARAKGNFELPIGSFAGLSTFTLQMDVNMKDAGADREPLFAMLPTPNVYNSDENLGQGIIFGDGWFDTANYTFLDGFYSTTPNAGWQMASHGDRPLTWSQDFLITFMFDGSELSVYFNNTKYLSVSHTDASLFSHYKYFRIGGLLCINFAMI